MELVNGEKIITQSDNKQIVLSTHRLRYYKSRKKNAGFSSLMVDKICHIELVNNKPGLLLLIFGILLLPVLLGIVLLLIYFLTNKHVISIASDGGKVIVFETQGMKQEFLIDFIGKVEKASFEIKSIYNSKPVVWRE